MQALWEMRGKDGQVPNLQRSVQDQMVIVLLSFIYISLSSIMSVDLWKWSQVLLQQIMPGR
jgi:hypothetical protein